jgi:hypothetical protein
MRTSAIRLRSGAIFAWRRSGPSFGLEGSRLARSSDLEDLDLARLTGRLVIHSDGTHDLREFNDRLLVQ